MKIVSGPDRKDINVEFQQNTCYVLHYVFCVHVPSQATDVIIILMMTVAWKLTDPCIGESGGRPPPYGPYIRPAERAKTPVVESPTYLTYIGIGRSVWLAQSIERPPTALTSHHGFGPVFDTQGGQVDSSFHPFGVGELC
jgi:hypothetical protein